MSFSLTPLTLALALFATLACNPAEPSDSSESKDVVSEYGRYLFYYYVDGADLVRAICPSGTVVFDRSTCHDRVRRVPLNLVREPVSEAFADALRRQDDLVASLMTKIDRIDLKLQELMATGSFPNAAHADELKAKIDLLEGDVTRLGTRVRDLSVQITQIEDRLAERPNGDLLQELSDRREERRAADVELQSLTAQRDSLRSELIALAADIGDEETFRIVKAQRVSAVADYEAAKDAQVTALKKLVTVDRIFAYMADSGMTYEQRPSTGRTPLDRDILDKIEDRFDGTSDGVMLFSGSATIIDPRLCASTCDITLQIDVDRGAHPSKIWCTVETLGGSCAYPSLYSPVGARVPAHKIDRENPNDASSYRSIFEDQAQGRWGFQQTCQRTGNFRPNVTCWIEVD